MRIAGEAGRTSQLAAQHDGERCLSVRRDFRPADADAYAVENLDAAGVARVNRAGANGGAGGECEKRLMKAAKFAAQLNGACRNCVFTRLCAVKTPDELLHDCAAR